MSETRQLDSLFEMLYSIMNGFGETIGRLEEKQRELERENAYLREEIGKLAGKDTAGGPLAALKKESEEMRALRESDREETEALRKQLEDFMRAYRSDARLAEEENTRRDLAGRDAEKTARKVEMLAADQSETEAELAALSSLVGGNTEKLQALRILVQGQLSEEIALIAKESAEVSRLNAALQNRMDSLEAETEVCVRQEIAQFRKELQALTGSLKSLSDEVILLQIESDRRRNTQ